MNVENLPNLLPLDFGNYQDPQRPILSTYYFAAGPHRVQGHQHPRAQILYPTSGVYHVRTSMGNWVVPPYQAVWIPSNIYHEIHSNHSVTSLMMFIDEAYADVLSTHCVVISVSTLLHELFVRTVSIGNDYQNNDKQRRFVQVLLDEIRDMEAAPLYLPLGSDNRVKKVIDHLLKHPNISGLEEIARICGASMRNLARLFQKDTGMSFSEWRKQLILMEAIDRLSNGISITEMALDFGYGSTSSFTAMFRRSLGVSPGRYLKKEHPNANIEKG
jgi:AraC-like DNA-binding protein